MYQLKVNQQQSIIALHQQGWSGRRIARELGLDRGTVGKYLAGDSKSAINPQTGSAAAPGPASLCEPWREQIEAGLAHGLSIQRIYQDLVAGQQFAGSYFAVRRFVLRQLLSLRLSSVAPPHAAPVSAVRSPHQRLRCVQRGGISP